MLRAALGQFLDGRSLARVALPWLLVAGAGALALPGCEVTPEKIELWKGTEKGPGKLRDALKSPSLPPDLRGKALAALAEIGELEHVEEDLKEIPDGQKREVVHAAVPALTVMARGKGTPSPGATTRLERQGKDALFIVRAAAAPEDRAAIDATLIEWTTVDLDGRMTAGVSSDRILEAIGAAAGPRLVAVITDPATSDVNRTLAAKIVGKVGDHAAREQAGAKLVERARAERRPSDPTLQQMGLVGGDHVVAWLTAVASDIRQPSSLRQQALMTLSNAPDPAELPTALRLAGDARAPGEVRDGAFEVLGKLGPAALPGLARLLDDKNEKIRWESVETMLLAGQVQAIPAVLDGLPTARSYSKEDLHDFVVRDLVKLGPAALPPLRDELRSTSWVARLSAAMAIAELGKAEDAPRLESLAADATRLKGWAAGATIGSEVKSLAAALRVKP